MATPHLIFSILLILISFKYTLIIDIIFIIIVLIIFIVPIFLSLDDLKSKFKEYRGANFSNINMTLRMIKNYDLNIANKIYYNKDFSSRWENTVQVDLRLYDESLISFVKKGFGISLIDKNSEIKADYLLVTNKIKIPAGYKKMDLMFLEKNKFMYRKIK